MASASGCITLSLALHAALLCSVATREPPARERQIGIDLGAMMTFALDDVPGTGASVHGASADEPTRHAPPRATAATPASPAPIASRMPLHPRAPITRPAGVAASPVALAEPQHGAAAPLEPVAAAPNAPAEPLRAAPPPEPASPAMSSPGAPGAVVPALAAPPPGGNLAITSGADNGGASGNGAGRVEQRGGSSEGRDGSGASGNGVASARRAVLLDYARRVRARIAEQREYPYAARRANLHGTVCLRIELAGSGRLLAAQPTCGEALGPLATAALAAVTRAAPFPALPAALGQHLMLDVPVVFELGSD